MVWLGSLLTLILNFLLLLLQIISSHNLRWLIWSIDDTLHCIRVSSFTHFTISLHHCFFKQIIRLSILIGCSIDPLSLFLNYISGIICRHCNAWRLGLLSHLEQRLFAFLSYFWWLNLLLRLLLNGFWNLSWIHRLEHAFHAILSCIW